MPRNPRDYKAEQKYDGQPAVIKRRAARNKARAMTKKKLGSAAVTGKDVNHIQPLIRGGKTTMANLNVQGEHANRSYPRDKHARMKSPR